MRGCSIRQQGWRFRVHKTRKTYQESRSSQHKYREGTQRRRADSERRNKYRTGEIEQVWTHSCTQRRCCAKDGPKEASREAPYKPGGQCCTKDCAQAQTCFPRSPITVTAKSSASQSTCKSRSLTKSWISTSHCEEETNYST